MAVQADTRVSSSTTGNSGGSAFDRMLMDFVASTNQPKQTPHQSTEVLKEEAVLVALTAYLTKRDLNSTKALCGSAGITAQDQLIAVEDIGLELILATYCARNQDFNPVYFKAEMAGLEIIKPLTTLKLIAQLQRWRIECVQNPTNKSKNSARLSSSTTESIGGSVMLAGTSATHPVVDLLEEILSSSDA